MESRVARIATAGLLHDIGKFWQRTGEPRPLGHDEAEHFANTYAHTLWTGQFLERHLEDAEATSWARMHHHPDSREAYLLSLADWLSSGERMEDAAQATDKPQAARLLNLLGRIAPDKAEGAQRDTYFPLAMHGDFDHFFPELGARCGEADYAALWKDFVAAVAAFPGRPLPHRTWLALMRRYTSRVPAATPTRVGAYVPDISLFDHCRTVAALAACFLADDMSEARASELRTAITMRNPDLPVLQEPICTLVCGDLSGIQNFLYTIVSSKAAKTLKGRSFALQLIADACAAEVCREAGVPETCIIYNGGGRFYALLPLGANVDQTAHRLSRLLHRHVGADLTVQVGGIEVGAADFRPERFSTQWAEAAKAAARAKQRKLTHIAREDYNAVFGFQDTGGQAAKCPVCGREVEGGNGADGELCDPCNHYVDLGQRIATAKWLAWRAPTDRPTGLNRFFAELGFEVSLERELRNLDFSPTALMQLGDFDPEALHELPRTATAPSYGHRFAARSWALGNEGGIKTFEELAKESTGANKLGVFRADVDNLGALFATGLGERASLSRVATLSALLKDFFEGYLDHVVETEYHGEVGVLYAGGDDLFVVGAWNRVIDFALDLRERFDDFSGLNPNFTFSGGVAMVDDHLPLRHAADLAHQYEEAAKQYVRKGREKNAITLFGVPVGFEEMDRFRDFHRLLLALLKPEGPLPKAFLRRLYDVWEVYRREQLFVAKTRPGLSLEDLKQKARWQRWRWMLTYGLRDFAKRHKDAENDIAAIQARILDANEAIEDRLGLPLRWTELLLKEDH